MPIMLWTYFNSITMLKLLPDINYLKLRYYGQPDELAKEQARLFKERGYHPLLSIIPTLLQLLLLIAVVEVIKLSSQNPAIDMHLGSIDLSLVPNDVGDIKLIFSPILAGITSLILCIAENKSNILQAEQSFWNKLLVSALSVGLSLFLGWFVSIGTALYWVCSNLYAVAFLYICNWIVRPKRYIDYEKLEDTKRQLKELSQTRTKGEKRDSILSKNRRREREDYKRFFSVINKHLVFYSESSGFYKYYKGFIEYLLKNTNIIIHYITSDPNDQIFDIEKKEGGQIRAYYIGESRLITLMMKLDTDVMVMTMPDLDKYHIKRSYVRKDIEYIFASHGIGSNNLTLKKGATESSDTIFCAGIHQRIEEEQLEELYKLPHKNLIEVGYPLIDDMRAAYKKEEPVTNNKKKILIAPSWQRDNIIDSCLEELLEGLKGQDYSVIVRPHPQELKLKRDYIDALKQKYQSDEIEIQTDFSSNSPVLEADLLITDWSDISWEYAFTTLRPVLFINTPMKVMNPDYQKIKEIPINIRLRDEIGKSLDTDKLYKVNEVVGYLLSHTDDYKERINELLYKCIYNPNHSAEVGADYIISAIQRKIKERKV